MGKKDKRIDGYIERSAEFARPVLKHLRKVVHGACPEVEETLKWGMPFFTYKGMLCHIAAFKHHCSFGFWKGRLIFGTAVRDGMGHLGKITALSDLPKDKVLAGYVKRAAELNEEGVKAPGRTRPKARKELTAPDYFLAALKKNRKARETFENFSYSHKKDYVQWISEAKREETRQQRLTTAIEWLSAGKARNWKWMNC